AVEKCSMKSCAPTSKGRSFLGLMVLSFGRFPPVKVKAPADVSAKIPAINITKEEARNLLIKCRKRLDVVIPLIRDASKHCRIKHARLGMLNARQWLKFILIHSKHHLKQLDRIQKKLQSP
ncbi:MAG TPA: DinB family protein, partial [Mucilaginibacter sp.]